MRPLQPNPNSAAHSYEPGSMDAPSTIYLTVADKDGNMVSLIQSNYRGMGSGMTPWGLGFVLQNRGEGFNLAEVFFKHLCSWQTPISYHNSWFYYKRW